MTVNFKGESAFGVAEKPEAQKMASEIQKFNKALRKAVPLTMQEWADTHENVSFPLNSVRPNSFKVIKNFADKKKAQAFLKTYKEKLAEKEKKEEALKEHYLTAMSEEKLQKLEEQNKLMNEAYQLLENKVKEVLKEMAEKEKKSSKPSGSRKHRKSKKK